MEKHLLNMWILNSFKNCTLFGMCLWRNVSIKYERIFQQINEADGKCTLYNFFWRSFTTNKYFIKNFVISMKLLLTNKRACKLKNTFKQNYLPIAFHFIYHIRGGQIVLLLKLINKDKDKEIMLNSECRPRHKVCIAISAICKIKVWNFSSFRRFNF